MALRTRSSAAALCLLALQLAAQLLAARAALPAMPRWAKGPSWRGQGEWPFYSVDQGKKNRDIMAAANKAGVTYDFLLYGDRCARQRPGAARGHAGACWPRARAAGPASGPPVALLPVPDPYSDCCCPSPIPYPRRSITQLIFRNGKAAWAAAFPPSRGWQAAPYGISGNDIQDLMWRLGAPQGWERPARAPRVVALL